ncbi:G2/mitotic-specific cyclin-B3 [Prorops nasuta]|uniref:G2/mitotic-specific cyclin-B3 n=1 Tax=Prorops nasuta TaxID=863751 RepID=UPI0034CEFCFF
MAPQKLVNNQAKQINTKTLTRKGITTRSQNSLLNNVLLKQSIIPKDIRSKRKAEASPLKEKTVKRSALGNITNAIGKSLSTHQQESKKLVKKPIQIKTAAQTLPLKAERNNTKSSDNNTGQPAKPKILPSTEPTQKEEKKVEVPSKNVNTRRSSDLEKSEDSSLYVSALEDISDSLKKIEKIEEESSNEILDDKKEKVEAERVEVEKVSKTIDLDAPPQKSLPNGVQYDFDVENWQDPFQVSHYAMDIFNYLKERESLFPIDDYIDRQVCLSRWMRSLLVDWMVEVQESFELNHETLYLAVKLVDLYLTKVTVGKETLQLLGAASIFIASKYDERIPPMVEDFLYICDGAYSQRELIRMEINILKVIDFDLGIPLSYRFLRRYARCAKVSMPTLTLARYVLEYSLMDYATIRFSDSKIAAAALLLALQMKDLGGWTPTLEYYTGYKVDQIRGIVHVLNQGLHRKHKEALTTVRNKYSHKIFFEVAKVPLKEELNI